ncbi:hypothetical protein P256_00220 [Acinetobacter nectaris CIP 110549]|uniref:Uncharacterized protein n=1 Tax=Acinetobacter nectaris CIP 110549 TaxID=1392540 RepID=V2TT63_9GAMM|nr:hypothetical protein [Acinetobacter nectaris]ESK41231.1 hypothetical protein P256_00220 [Acinetobacter nectaris CIP 110549]
MSTNTHKKVINLEPVGPITEKTKGDNYQTHYFDKMSSFAIGSDTARIGFGTQEHNTGKLVESQTVILPLKSLIELYNFLEETLKNPDLQNKIQADRDNLFKNLK